MNIKQKIWSLPIVTILIFAVGIAITYALSSSTSTLLNRVGRVDYPFPDKPQLLLTDLFGIQETLIGDSVNKVQSGSRLVAQAGETMAKIVGSIKRVTDIVAEISAASSEQISGIEQVNRAIVRMEETTRQNAALLEQAATAAKSLEEQARDLSEAVSVFKIDAAVTPSARIASSRPAPEAKAVDRQRGRPALSAVVPIRAKV